MTVPLRKLLNRVVSDFQEALETTAEAKSNFAANRSDLLARGERLIRESVQCGVTSIRAHVEVDSTVNDACLDTALSLKSSFRDVCDIQIAGSCTSNHSMLDG
jgi:cytosine/adenosine deaminase-related metal-dependent hydrolase